MTPAERHKDKVARAGCVICRKLGLGITPAQIHHIAEGSGKRSDFAVAGLCPEHHTGGAGFHKMGTEAFCKLYRIHGETEWGLMTLVNEYLARDGI